MLGGGSRFFAVLTLAVATPVSAQSARVGAAARVVGVVVGDLGNPNQRAAFDERALSECGRRIRVVSERHEDAAPAGTLIEQRPPAGQRVACIGSVTLVYSTGPSPPPPPPPPPVRITVPRLDSDAVRARFAAEVRSRCRRRFDVQISTVAGPPPGRSYIRQYPEVGRSIGCDDGAVAYLSDGSLVAPPPPPLRFQVGLLDSAVRRAAFEGRASRFCGEPHRLELRTQPDSRAPGTYVAQSVPPDTIFTCASAINVTVTGPLPPWLMPDFRLTGAATKLQQTAAERCHAELPIVDRVQHSALAEGTLIAQDPRTGATIDCTVTVTLTRARKPTPSSAQPTDVPGTEAGNVATGTATSASDGDGGSERSTTVPDLVGIGIGAVDDWTAKLMQLCGSADGVAIVNSQSGEQPGTILSQSLAADAPYKCSDSVVFTVAVAAPPFPWWLVAIASGLVAATGVATYLLRTWPWPPIPTVEIGASISLASPADDDPTAALPLVALESLRPEVALACPNGVPVESVETYNG